MQNKRIVVVFLAICLFTSCEKDAQQNPDTTQKLSLQALDISTGMPVQRTLPGTDVEISGNGFSMAFYDKATGTQLGYLMDINVASETFPDGSMEVENYTIFEFAADNSSLVLHNFIEMTPVDSTTLEGKIPVEKTQNNLISGTGKYADVNGGSTLNAILDMSAFAEGTIGFNCIYDLQIKQ